MLGANHIPEDEPLSALSNQSHLNVSNETDTLSNWNTTDRDATYWNNSNGEEVSHEFVCAFYNPDFIIYSSLGSFYIPCMVMIFLYGRIFKVSFFNFVSFIDIPLLAEPWWLSRLAPYICSSV